MKALIATIVVALIAAAPASADLPTDTLAPYGPAVDISRGQAAALAYWGRDPDCPDGVEATLFDDPDPRVSARGGRCHIWIDQSTLQDDVANYGPDAAAVYTCDSVVHEFGHLLGYGHSDVATGDDPLDIMNGSVLILIPQCADPEAPSVTPVAAPPPLPPPPQPDAAPVKRHHHRHHHRRRHHRHHVMVRRIG